MLEISAEVSQTLDRYGEAISAEELAQLEHVPGVWEVAVEVMNMWKIHEHLVNTKVKCKNFKEFR